MRLFQACGAAQRMPWLKKVVVSVGVGKMRKGNI